MKRKEEFIQLFKYAPYFIAIIAVNLIISFVIGPLSYIWQTLIVSFGLMLNIIYFIKFRDKINSPMFEYAINILSAFIVMIYGYCARYSMFSYTAFDNFIGIASLIGIIYSYMRKNYFILFFYLMLFANFAVSFYVDFFDLNIYYLNASDSILLSIIPLVLYIFLGMALLHAYFKEKFFSYCYLLIFLITQTFYCFIIKFEFDIIAGILSFIGFLSVFIIYFYERYRAQSAAGNKNSEEMKKKNQLLPVENSVIMLLNIVLIFTVLVYGSWFYFKKNSASAAYIEVYAQGAALYYDSFIGYMAKFKMPFDNIRLEANENKLKKIKRNKYLGISVGEKLSIKSELIGVEQLPDGSKIAYSEPACSIMAVDKILAAKISPRFVYKLKIGVLPNGDSYIEKCDVAGDRFFMFDDENLYNKYKSNVKSFTAVSDDLNYTAVYDFSGNIRIINNSDGKNILLINDLTGFKSVAAYGNKDFIMLLKDKIVWIMTETLKIKNYALPDVFINKENISISNADESGRVLICQNGVPALIFQSSSGFSELKQAEEFNNMEIIYFKNNFIAAVSYLSSALSCAHISDESGYKIKMTGSLTELENFMSAISNPPVVNNENEKKRKFIFYGYSQKEKKVIETLITYVPNDNSVNYISGYKKNSLEFEPAAICAGGYSDGLFILNNSEKSILNIKKGFFYDDYKKTSLASEEKKKNYVQPLPLNLYCANGYLYVLFENTYYILDASDLKILKKFEYCR